MSTSLVRVLNITFDDYFTDILLDLEELIYITINNNKRLPIFNRFQKKIYPNMRLKRNKKNYFYYYDFYNDKFKNDITSKPFL